MNVLIVVAKRPAPGQTKTRLVPPLSVAQAAALYEGFLRDTLNLMRGVPNVRRVIAYLPHAAQEYFSQLAPDFELLPQRGDGLGARLDQALTYYLSRGVQRAVIMNSDGPTVPIEYLREAFAQLIDPDDIVLGPSDDGGYYLIGLRKPAPHLLRGVRMSTPRVLIDTVQLAQAENRRVNLLPPWYDVDDQLLLGRLIAELHTSAAAVAPYTRSVLERLPPLG
jgi:rSAM/selenodomain-associated transferase 1